MPEKKFAVFGIDGAHPETVNELLKKGLLPNLSEFISNGALEKLETVHASQSPVAWASFMTGTNPGKHGIIDFIIRDPSTMQIELGLVSERAHEHGIVYESLLKERPVWEKLKEKGTSLFIPVSFPPVPFNGHLLCGMGVPDARNTQGICTIYDENPVIERQEIIQLEFEGNSSQSGIIGYNEEKIPLKIERKAGAIEFELQGRKFSVKEGQLSNWIEIEFSGSGKKVNCVFRIKLLSAEKGKTKFYLSPVLYNPSKPLMHLSHPPEFAKEISEKVGNYKPVSFESDVYGLKEELSDENTWLEDMYYTLEKRAKAADYAMRNKKWQYFALDLFAVDRVQHLFYRYMDRQHPLYEESNFKYEIEKCYIKADEYLGMLMKNIDENCLAFVISDHGFGPYRHNVNINAVLEELGFLYLKEKGVSMQFGDIDFTKTQAYSIGFGSIFINLRGREKYGIIESKDLESTKQNVISALKKYKFNGKNIFLDALDAEKLYGKGKLLPDILPIFPLGSRASRESTIGSTAPDKGPVFENRNKWSGDHIGPHRLEDNAGIIAANQPLNIKGASIMDLTPSAVDYFKSTPNPNYDGNSLLEGN